MQKVLTAEEMREIDRLTTEKYGIPSILLMENAAHAAARVIAEKLGGSVKGKSFLILCGKGNNGGDGAALARILWTLDASIRIILFGKVEDTKGDARLNFEIAKKHEQIGAVFPGSKNGLKHFSFHEVEDVKSFYEVTKNFREDVCVDALFGTGLTRRIEGELEKIIANINHWEPRGRKSFIVSLDLPSGVNADWSHNYSEFIGEKEIEDDIFSAVQPDLTITFTAPKIANVLPPVSNASKEFVTVAIGSPAALIKDSPSKLFLAEKSDVQKWLLKTEFEKASYKNKRGHALLIAGSNNYAGAAVLAGNAVIVSGVGLTTIATAKSAQNSIASRVLPEVMTRGVAETENGAVSEDAFAELDEFIESSIDAVEIGSGLATDESTKRLVEKIVARRRTPVVIDADALTALAPFATEGSDELPLILTPHEGEFLKILGTKDREAIKDRVRVAREFAQKHKVILVLKGERALVAAPDGRVCVNPTGNSGLGKAGNGDTLAGVITGFVAQGAQMKVDIFETTVAAVYLAGLAGDIAARKYGKRSMLASDVRECLTEAFRQIEGTPSS